MKINAEYYVKIFCVLILIFTSHINSASFGMLKKNVKKSYKEPVEPVGNKSSITDSAKNNLSNQPIQFQDWVKYLHYGEADAKKPKAFFKNTQFDMQNRRSVTTGQPQADSDGISFRIPSEMHFFAVVYNDSINIFNSRQHNGGYTNVIDTLNFDYIDLIPDGDIKKGGVRDYGKFDEGFCFRVNTKIPTKHFIQSKENIEPKDTEYKTEKWVICSDKSEIKDKLMDKIIKLKLKNQHSKNIWLDYENKESSDANGTKPATSGPKSGKAGEIYEAAKKINDCYMIILHPWTPCTLACGGGKSYLQLMKVEAKNGGQDCKTKETILSHDCNTQPCPTVSQVTNMTKNLKDTEPTSIVKNATVRMMSISSRPQRYDKCHLKETDALMEKKDETTKDFTSYPLIPVRLVMNDKTVTAYLDDNLTNKVVTYLLDQSSMIRKDDKKCFVIQNNVRNDKFCMLDSAVGDFVEEWYYDFNLFKLQCKKDRAKTSLVFTEEKRLEDEFKNKVENIKLELVQSKAEIIKKQVGENEKKKLVNKIDQVRKISLHAIEKEMRLEDLLEKEEESREENESQTLEQQIQQEKKKEECLLKAIKEKEIENQYNIAKAQAEHAIQQITKNTQAQIAKQREGIARKIIEMRQKQKRKKAQLKNEIMSIRTQIAERLQKINKIGDATKCTKLDKIEDYCNANFTDNYLKFQDCTKKESFCYICCENEFGDLHVLQRDQCYSSCDTTPTSS